MAKQKTIRLDDGRANYFLRPLSAFSDQDSAIITDRVHEPLTSPITLDILAQLLKSHNWTIFNDDDTGMSKVMHADVREGTARSKYIIGEDQNGAAVLLSRQDQVKTDHQTVGTYSHCRAEG
jgi:hypothetical protein